MRHGVVNLTVVLVSDVVSLAALASTIRSSRKIRRAQEEIRRRSGRP